MKILPLASAAILCLVTQLRAAPDTPTHTPSIPYHWSNVAMGGTGFVSGTFAHPRKKDLFYARTDVGGAYRFNPVDSSWVPLLDWLPQSNGSAMGVEALALDPRDPAKIYLLTGTPYWSGGTCILRSADFGHSWQTTDVSELICAHGNKSGRHTGERLAVDPHQGKLLFCGSRTSGLWHSTDAGASWSAVTGFAPGPDIAAPDGSQKPSHPASTRNGNGICFVIFDPASGTDNQPTRTLYLGLSRPRIETRPGPNKTERATPDGNIYQSNDGGRSWQALPALPEAGIPQGMANQTFEPSRAVLAEHQLIVTFQAETGGGGGVFRYDPATTRWTDITPGAFSSKEPNKGQWQRINIPYGGIDLTLNAPRRMLLSSFGHYSPQKDRDGHTVWGEKLFYSPLGPAEDGKSWVDVFGSDKGRLDPQLAFAKGKNIHWGAAVTLDPCNPQRAFMTSGNGIWGTTNLQDSLSTDKDSRSAWGFPVKGLEEAVALDVASIPGGPLLSAILDYAGFANAEPAQYAATGQYQVCAGANVRLATAGSGHTAMVIRLNDAGDLCKSPDSGSTWQKLAATGLGKAGGNARLALSADGAVLLYTAGNGRVYRNEDAARLWPTERWLEVKDLAAANHPQADPLNSRVFHAYQNPGGVLLRSDDAGQSFHQVSTLGIRASGLQAAPGRSADLWLPLGKGGVARFVDQTIEKIPLFHCQTLGFGRGQASGDYPCVFIWGQPLKDDPPGLYRSTDTGKSWRRVNDDDHQYGGLGNGGFVKGDMNVFGRVYMSSPGRGIPYGTPVQ